MSTEHTAKRRRRQSDERGPENRGAYEKGDLWFDDGNVVLVAEGTAFCVHRGVLSSKSDIFRDMFSIPQPLDEETYEGHSVVHLADLKADVYHMLAALYNGREYYHYRKRLPFNVVSALLQMGTKYEIDDLRSEGISRLRTHLPNNLCPTFHHSFESPPNVWDNTIELSAAHIIAVINLARKLDLHDLLPVAFYFCANLPTDIILDGYKDSHGTHWKLSSEDLKRCFNGRLMLQLHGWDQYRVVLRGVPSPFCDGGTQCRNALATKGRSVWTSVSPTNVDALRPLDFLGHWGLCKPCKLHFNQEREHVFNELPSIFQLEDIVSDVWPGAFLYMS
ncbi:hypothetical protein BXZ70DRAFT_1007189 [Cristinia sonorae]|uniref:BTB domain-containing protein n=1 Tax=Cristinia sonorae TaxID=1940300 RepID=A0A8K0UQR1_9AGAR|nr:hypothetical protein BXZ70DRAFT_1007189 [Cristinia sonorae]